MALTPSAYNTIAALTGHEATTIEDFTNRIYYKSVLSNYTAEDAGSAKAIKCWQNYHQFESTPTKLV